MSNRKTHIESTKVRDFLKENISPTISNLKTLEGGEMSCPFSFTADGVEYVMRIDSHNRSYQKDAYAWKHFASKELPIPEMVRLGIFDDKHYFAITKKAEGNILNLLNKEETLKIIPSLIITIEAIHAIDVSQTEGYGYWDSEGKATYNTWKEYLLSINENIEEWKKKNSRKYFDQAIMERIYNAMLPLVAYISEEKHLLHGDYGFSNVVTDGEKVTAVLDWGEGRFGDFVFDIAWLDLWQDAISYEKLFKKYYESVKKPIPHFSERIRCYKLHLLYGSLKFIIESDQEDQYREIENKLHSLLDSRD